MLASLFGRESRRLDTLGQVSVAVDAITESMNSELFQAAITNFSSLRPPDQADVMAQLRRDHQVKLLSLLTPKNIGLIVEELEPDDVVEISRDMELADLSQVLDEISPEIAADVLRELPDETRSKALSSMTDADDVIQLIKYEDDDAGGLMTPESAVTDGGVERRFSDGVARRSRKLCPLCLSPRSLSSSFKGSRLFCKVVNTSLSSALVKRSRATLGAVNPLAVSLSVVVSKSFSMVCGMVVVNALTLARAFFFSASAVAFSILASSTLD